MFRSSLVSISRTLGELVSITAMREQQHAVDMRAAVDEAKNNAAVEAAMRGQQYEMAKRAAVEDAIILQIAHFTFFTSRLSTLNTKENCTNSKKRKREGLEDGEAELFDPKRNRMYGVQQNAQPEQLL